MGFLGFLDSLAPSNLELRSSNLESVTSPASGVADFRGVTGGVYKARERIHRSMLTCDY